jgi:hypothetical protein
VIGYDPDSENDGAFPRFTLISSTPLLCHQGSKEDRVEAPVSAGDRFNVSQYSSMPLQEYMGCEVWVKALSKRPIDGGKTLWMFELRVSPETKRLVADRQAKQLAEATTAIGS